MMEQLTANTTVFQAETKTFMAETRTNFKNQGAAIHNSDVQMGNISAQLANRTQALPSGTVKNPKEQVNLINLRSGKKLLPGKTSCKTPTPEPSLLTPEGAGLLPCPTCKKRTASQPSPRPASRPTSQLGGPTSGGSPVKGEGSVEAPATEVTGSYPSRLTTMNSELTKFMEIFRKLEVNMHFSDLINKVSRYARYLKELLAKKKKVPYGTKAGMNKEVSAILNRKLSKKEKDPGHFLIPSSIGNQKFKALCDLGVSINLMPLSIYKRLGIEKLEDTTINLIIADQSEVKPVGVVENVLVRAEHLMFPVDFVVIDKDEGDVPLIFGRPFLYTAKAVIDVYEGELTLTMVDEKLLIKIFPNEEEKEEGEIEGDSLYTEMKKREGEHWTHGGCLQRHWGRNT